MIKAKETTPDRGNSRNRLRNHSRIILEASLALMIGNGGFQMLRIKNDGWHSAPEGYSEYADLLTAREKLDDKIYKVAERLRKTKAQDILRSKEVAELFATDTLIADIAMNFNKEYSERIVRLGREHPEYIDHLISSSDRKRRYGAYTALGGLGIGLLGIAGIRLVNRIKRD